MNPSWDNLFTMNFQSQQDYIIYMQKKNIIQTVNNKKSLQI